MAEDSQSWAWTNNGVFSVKSAYGVAIKVLKEKKTTADGECSDGRPTKKLWKMIWSLNCPSKIKHFMWRSCKNILPTNHCLKKRKIVVEEGCVFCGERETTGHTLWGCRVAAEVWQYSGLHLPVGLSANGEFSDLIGWLLEASIEVDWDLFATMAWCVWKNRNEKKHEGRSKQAQIIAGDACRFAEEFRQNNVLNSKPKSQPSQARASWCPPYPGWYKINVDGAIFNDSRCCGIGVVIRNECGHLMGAMSKKLHLPLGPLEVEAKATEEGIILAKELGLRRVVVEGDSMTVMSALSGSNRPPSSIQKVIECSVSRLRGCLDWEAKYVSRNCNVAAHLLARNACSVGDSVVWVEDTPPAIVNQVLLDVSLLGVSPC